MVNFGCAILIHLYDLEEYLLLWTADLWLGADHWYIPLPSYTSDSIKTVSVRVVHD
jgi:hypothetical protein